MKYNKYFLSYQIDWLKDTSPIKIWEKSRRIGATYVQSFEDVMDIASAKIKAVWFSSADESAAKEYIEYCGQWATLLKLGAEKYKSIEIITDKDIKTFSMKFKNGGRITALSSNPKAFRSKGGKVVLDEFAWHEQQDKLWAAARPCITWGYPLRILSTHNGKACRFYRSIEDIKKGSLNWSLHTTSIQKAVEDGLVDKILGRTATEEEKIEWLESQRKDCVDENTWRQEYCCEAIDETSAFFTYDLIRSCEKDNLLDILKEDITGDFYIGMDIGRKKDLSVIWGIEKLGAVKYTRIYKVLDKMPFKHQKEILFKILKHPKLRRACIDATGLGMQLAEEAQDAFGKYTVEAITFTNHVKEELAYNLKIAFEDRQIYIPSDVKVREDLHSVKKVTTLSGNTRFDTTENKDGHADRFWALALANYASLNCPGEIYIATRNRVKTYQSSRAYSDFSSQNIQYMY